MLINHHLALVVDDDRWDSHNVCTNEFREGMHFQSSHLYYLLVSAKPTLCRRRTQLWEEGKRFECCEVTAEVTVIFCKKLLERRVGLKERKRGRKRYASG